MLVGINKLPCCHFAIAIFSVIILRLFFTLDKQKHFDTFEVSADTLVGSIFNFQLIDDALCLKVLV